MKSEKIQRKASPGRSLLIMATACRHAALLAGAVLFLFFAAAGAEAEEAFEVGASGFGQVMEEDRTDESRDKEGEEAGSEDFKEFDSDDEFGEFGEFDSQDSDDRPGVYDPLSGYNRFMTSVNDKVYFWVLKPAATGYAAVAPRLVRKSVNRFFKNLGYPVRFVNNVLQLKLRRAGVETARFVVNTTIGLGGLADPAEQWMELEPYPEDFGQTLGHYGVGGGFHLVLPLLGPSNLRDSLASVPDGFLEPTYYVEPWEAGLLLDIYSRLNYISLHLGEYESLKKDAVDWYIFLRNAYEANRNKKIRK